MRSLIILGCALVAGGTFGVACSASKERTSNTGGDGGDLGVGGAGGGFMAGPGSGGGSTICNSGENDDQDADGYTVGEGDCNDCDENVSPGAVEVATDPDNPDLEPSDEDCDNEVDEAIEPCDSGLAFDDADPMHAAQALEVCTVATEGANDYGVLEASWVRPNGTPYNAAQVLQFGLQSAFGDNVTTQVGDSMLVLSSGAARLPGQTGAPANHQFSAIGDFVESTPPANFPAEVPGCMGETVIYDDIGLQLRMRAPTNATGFRYLFKFYSFEFAEYVCTPYNDQYVALVEPAPEGSINGNISFDANSNPVSVNIAFFDICDPAATDFAAECAFFGGTCPTKPDPYCPSGLTELAGTGFDTGFGGGEDAGATSWLQTTAPVEGGAEFTIRFAVWDTGDWVWDSSVLVDGFEWIGTPGTTVGTVEPPQ